MKIRPSIVLQKDNAVLLMQYHYNNNERLNLPGGNLEEGETMAQSLVREMYEELGIEVQIHELLFVGEVVSSAQKTTLHCVFAGTIVNGIPQLNPAETTAESLVWLPAEQLLNINLYPNIAQKLYLHLHKKQTPSTYVGQIEQEWF